MSSAGGVGGSISGEPRWYWCFMCPRGFKISSSSGDIICPNCDSGFVEEIPRLYWCYWCLRSFSVFSSSGDTICPNCDGGFTQDMKEVKELLIRNLNPNSDINVVPLFPQALPSDPEVFQTSLQRVYEDDKTWRIVGLVSSVVGLSCCAFSPSFIRLIGEWTPLKFFLYGVLSLVIFTTIFIAKKSSPSKQHVLQKLVAFAVLMFIAVYTYYYDRAVNEKPDVLGLVSNAAFALVSLSLSRLIKFGHEMGIFAFFLSCFAVQLWTIKKVLILVAIGFGCPVFLMHYSSDSGHSRQD